MSAAAVSTDSDEPLQPVLDLQRDGVTVYLWRLPYAEILIEVFDDGTVAVNGERVTPARMRDSPNARLD